MINFGSITTITTANSITMGTSMISRMMFKQHPKSSSQKRRQSLHRSSEISLMRCKASLTILVGKSSHNTQTGLCARYNIRWEFLSVVQNLVEDRPVLLLNVNSVPGKRMHRMCTYRHHRTVQPFLHQQLIIIQKRINLLVLFLMIYLVVGTYRQMRINNMMDSGQIMIVPLIRLVWLRRVHKVAVILRHTNESQQIFWLSLWIILPTVLVAVPSQSRMTKIKYGTIVT